MSFADLAIAKRLELLELKSCRPLPDAKAAIKFALTRFHESWTEYRTITPTLYAIKDGSMGIYLTLGKLRRNYTMSWETLEAITEALEESYQIEGYLLASEGITEDDPQLVFALQGHHEGERHYGALELITLNTYPYRFITEFDVSGESWKDLKLQASANNPLLQR